MSTFFNPSEHQKIIIRGSYNYLKNNNLYSEENFEVYKDHKMFTMHFLSEIHTRLVTGELLRIKVLYSLGKDYIPTDVKIERVLGSQFVNERYIVNKKENNLIYTYKNNNDEQKIEILTGPKFHISTPATAPSMLFLNSKRIDPNSDNYFTLYQCHNHWKFKNKPFPQNIILRKISVSSERITIDGNPLNAIQYYLFEDIEEDILEEQGRGSADAVTVYISPHVTIPYIVQENSGTKIQIKYLNNLDD